MRRLPGRPRPRTLRGRLVAVVLCLTAVCLVAFSVTGAVLLRGSLLGDLDSRLLELARPIAMGPPPDAPVHGPDPGPMTPTDYRVLALDADGGVEWSTGRDGEGGPDTSGADPAALAANEPFTLPDASDGADWRAVAVRASDGGVVLVARSLAEIDYTLTRLAAIEAAIGTALLLVLGAGAVSAVRFQLRPLDRIGRTAEAIAGGALDARVSDPDPRTETGRLAISLNTMLAELAKAMDERARSEEQMRQFVADASHELRTPLASVRGFAELHRQSRERGTPAPPESVDRWMERIECEAARMGLLVEDLLMLARFDVEPELESCDVDLARLARDAAADARARAPLTPVEVAADDSVRIVGDERRLRQVLANLIGNSLVHTPEGTPVRVVVERTTDVGPRPGAAVSGALPDGVRAAVSVTVHDEGPGVGRAQVARVFDRFYRVDPGRSRDKGGSGLGLAISAAIVAAHQGRIEMASLPGRGTDVTVLLPLEY
ncbi:sensor histidine kinase [Actinorugispora endophytica]|uniref:histidine kinase n=1 Tax=Actinorugispora endophytica TaxID=1605990 RepID=A0A4R6V304_9ACTN|nr:HAMP domain-containing sensor histidine kinase [Actinorugispora endophytica]TDQ52897.1 two-component system OmpR family sensor kinase [Actinorugispora endophytica]